MPTFICFAFHQKDPNGPIQVWLVCSPPQLGAGAAGLEVLTAAAPGHLVLVGGLGPAAILHLRAVGPVNARTAAALAGSPVVIVAQAPLQAPATAALTGSPVVVMVQAPL